MKKSLLLLVLSLGFAQAEQEDIDGYDIFKRDCSKCHVEMMTPKDTLAALKAKAIVAPPMNEVGARIREVVQVSVDSEEIEYFARVSFIKEYLKKPDIFYSICKPHAKEIFGAMPAQTQLTPAESQAVAEWILDRYEDVEFK